MMPQNDNSDETESTPVSCIFQPYNDVFEGSRVLGDHPLNGRIRKQQSTQ